MQCKTENCSRTNWARGYCSVHYEDWYTATHPKSQRAIDGEARRRARQQARRNEIVDGAKRRTKDDVKYRNTHKKECNRRVAVWADAHPEKLRARDAKRRAQKLHACPSWADLDAIEAVYAEAQRLTRETGILHHVDHIYPLISPYMCGLHVPENLQVLVGTENLSKGNKIVGV
jgi:hypothetical protein